MAKRSRRHFGSVITRPGRPGYYIRIRHDGLEQTRYAGISRERALNDLARIWKAVRTGTTVDEAAVQVLGPARGASAPTPATTSPEPPSFTAVAERYFKSVAAEKKASTLREDRARLGVVLRAPWSQEPISRIGRGDVATWLDEIGSARKGGRGLTPASLNRYRSLISVIFNFAVERELVANNPVSKLSRGAEGKREEFLTAEELLSLLEHCRPELRLLFMVAATTGVRQGVLRQLRWADIDLEAGTMLVKASYAKTGKPQLFHLVPQVVDGLRKLRDGTKIRHFRGDDAVFRTKTGRPWGKSWLCHLVRRVVDACPGIPEQKRRKVSFHTLRHSFASLLMLDGVNLRKLQEALSHSNLNLTARYSHLNSDAMREVQQRVAHFLDPDGPDRVRERPNRGVPKGYQASVGG